MIDKLRRFNDWAMQDEFHFLPVAWVLIFLLQILPIYIAVNLLVLR